jgi:26S proteasome regulatory subunit N1
MTPSPQAESTTENKENATAAGEIKPDPDYEWRRQAMDLIKDWQSHDSDENKDKEYRENTLLPKIKDLVRHNLTNNAEVEACDILMEIERIEILNEMAEQLKHIDFERICLYLLRFTL